MTPSWEVSTLQQLRDAVQQLLRGDGSAYGKLWSHADDATMMGAYGGLSVGWAQISAAIDRAAQNYSGWQPEYSEQLLTAYATADLGHVILREQVANRAGGDAVRSRRVTVLYRREADGWRIFHHHSDPLYTPAPPENAP